MKRPRAMKRTDELSYINARMRLKTAQRRNKDIFDFILNHFFLAPIEHIQKEKKEEDKIVLLSLKRRSITLAKRFQLKTAILLSPRSDEVRVS